MWHHFNKIYNQATLLQLVIMECLTFEMQSSKMSLKVENMIFSFLTFGFRFGENPMEIGQFSYNLFGCILKAVLTSSNSFCLIASYFLIIKPYTQQLNLKNNTCMCMAPLLEDTKGCCLYYHPIRKLSRLFCFTEDNLQLAKCKLYQHLDGNIPHNQQVPDVL